MTKIEKIKLQHVLDNNRKWPMVIVGAKTDDFEDAMFVSASIDERKLNTLSKFDKRFLIIDGLDNVDYEVQEKFVSLIKDRKIGIHKLPDSVQIVIPITVKEKLSKKIQSLILSWELK